MESSGPNRVRGDSGSHVSVDGEQASHAPSIHEQGKVPGGTLDILQQIDQALHRVAQPSQVVLQKIATERMEKYQPIDFLGKKDDEPSMAENWLERIERML